MITPHFLIDVSDEFSFSHLPSKLAVVSVIELFNW